MRRQTLAPGGGKRPVSLGHSYTRGLKGLRMPNIPYRLSLRQRAMLCRARQMLSSTVLAADDHRTRNRVYAGRLRADRKLGIR